MASLIVDQDILRLAGKLSVASTETEWRSAASRAYFAAFHRVRILLLGMGFEVPRGDQSHGYLWRRLQSCQTTSIGVAGTLLSQLRGVRNRADYDLNVEFLQREAMYCVESAADIFQVVERLSPDDRQQALETMKEFEQNILRESTWRQRPR